MFEKNKRKRYPRLILDVCFSIKELASVELMDGEKLENALP